MLRSVSYTHLENSGVTTSKFQMQDLPQDVAKVVDKMNVGEISKAFTTVSYTHLDVYKRQVLPGDRTCR